VDNSPPTVAPELDAVMATDAGQPAEPLATSSPELLDVAHDYADSSAALPVAWRLP
jgi:hypothetical protein